MMQVQETINDRSYTVYKMPVTQALGTVSRISGLIKKDIADEGDILGMLMGALGNPDVVNIIKDLCKSITYSGKQVNFDTHFMEFPQDLLPVVGLSLRENCMPFFAPEALETLMTMLTSTLQE